MFVLFIGAPPPAVRSAVMLLLVVAARARQRPTLPWGVWAASCAVPLIDPHAVLELGWQLSTAGMAGLLASGRVARWVVGRRRGWQRTILSSMVATTVASLATAPLVAWVFGRVSLVGVLTNVVAAPALRSRATAALRLVGGAPGRLRGASVVRRGARGARPHRPGGARGGVDPVGGAALRARRAHGRTARRWRRRWRSPRWRRPGGAGPPPSR